MIFGRKLAANIKRARMAAGLTQLQLAQRICRSKNCISMYEAAKRMPSVETVSMLASVLDVTLEDLIPEYSWDYGSTDNMQVSIFDLIGEHDA